MLCEHLAKLEQALLRAGVKEISRGQPWSGNCRQWVYFDVQFAMAAVRKEFVLCVCVIDEENLDPRSGTERGFVCEQCHDAVMGRLQAEVTFP